MKLISEFVVSNYLTISKIFKSPTKPASWHSKVLFGKAFAKRFCVGVFKTFFEGRLQHIPIFPIALGYVPFVAIVLHKGESANGLSRLLLLKFPL